MYYQGFLESALFCDSDWVAKSCLFLKNSKCYLIVDRLSTAMMMASLIGLAVFWRFNWLSMMIWTSFSMKPLARLSGILLKSPLSLILSIRWRQKVYFVLSLLLSNSSKMWRMLLGYCWAVDMTKLSGMEASELLSLAAIISAIALLKQEIIINIWN